MLLSALIPRGSDPLSHPHAPVLLDLEGGVERVEPPGYRYFTSAARFFRGRDCFNKVTTTIAIPAALKILSSDIDLHRYFIKLLI